MNDSLIYQIQNRLLLVSDTPLLDASILLANTLQKSRTWVMAHPEISLSVDQRKTLEKSILQFEDNIPLPYILGHWEFFGLDFEITPEVLIPRPETELLVERSTEWLRQHPDRLLVADIGTGSGVIAITIALHNKNISVIATDLSKAALDVAKQNALRHHVDNRIDFIHCDLLPLKPIFDHQEKKFDLICANLPYIPSKTLSTLPIHGREPSIALDGGNNGFKLIERLLQLAPPFVAPHSLLLIEFESTLGHAAEILARQYFPQAKISIHKDFSGLDRLLEIET